MSFKFAILCHLFCHFILNFKPFQSIMLSTIPLLFVSRHSTPITQCNCYFRPKSPTPLPTSTCQQNRCDSARFCAISFRHFVYSTPLLSAHPSVILPHNFSHNYKIVFPSTFFTLCLLITQVETLPPSHKLSSHLQQI